MQKVTTTITPQDVMRALFQEEGIIVDVDDGYQYSFVPHDRPLPIGADDLRTSGTVIMLNEGQFTEFVTEADLYIRKAGLIDMNVEIDIFPP